MAPTIPDIPHEQIKPLIRGLFHAGRSIGQADVYSVEWKGGEALLKDFSGRPAWVRGTWGRVVIAREFRALRRLHGVVGIPRLIARVGPYAILMERLQANRFPRRIRTPPPVEYFARASTLLRELHERGIGHGDVRRKNLLIDERGFPYLIDFATAITAKPGVSGCLSRSLSRRAGAIDRFHLAQMKADFYPHSLTEEERASLEHPPWYLRAGQFFKKRIYRYRKPRHRRRLLKRIFRF